ncbi:MAG: hypothetical protein AAGI91_01835 [Bacteroidota bacterium]
MADTRTSRTRAIERVVHKSDSFEDAAAWDRAQHRSLSPQERQRIARVLKARAFPSDAPDVRAWRVQ